MKENKMEHQPEPAIPEKPKKAVKEPARGKKPKKDMDGVQLPVLVEFTYTVSILLLIVLALTVILMSFLHGASLLAIILRTSVAIFVMGGLLILISSQISSGLLFSSKVEQDEHEKKQAEKLENPPDLEESGKAEV